MFGSKIPQFLMSFFSICLTSASLAAIITLDATPQVKILLIYLGFQLFSIGKHFIQLKEKMHDVYYFNRLNYIATEQKRLSPEDTTPANDILIDDLRIEKDREKAKELFNPISPITDAFVSVCINGVFGLLYVLATLFFISLLNKNF